MGVAAVVLHCLPLHRLLGQLPGELDRPRGARQHADFEGRERPAGVAVAHFGQKPDRVVVEVDLALPQTALLVGHRPQDQRLDVLYRKRLEQGMEWDKQAKRWKWKE